MLTQLSILDAIREGEALKQQGINTAVSHANAVGPDWSGRVWDIFIEWLANKPVGYQFMTEDFRLHCVAQQRIEQPPSLRAYGFIAPKAVREKLIQYHNTKKVLNPKAHQARASVWSKI